MAYSCLLDRQWTFEFVSDGCLELTGYAPDILYDSGDVTFNDIIAPEYKESVWTNRKQAAENKEKLNFEYEITTIDSKRKWVLEMGECVYDEKGDVIALEGIILDITDRKNIEDHLKYISEHDALTGLYNSYYLDLLLEKDSKKKYERKRAAISINLNTFYLLTAYSGYQYTQDMIKNVAFALSEYCTDKRLLFKTSEGRFVFYLRDYKDKNELIDFTETILGLLRTLFIQDRVSGGVGVVEIEQDQNNFDIDMIRRKLIIATENSIGIFDKDFKACFYNKELELEKNREKEIRKALSTIAVNDQGGELFLQYQPILDLETESICAFEALARLKTDELGSVSPAEFIPIAEKSKLIIPIGEKIILRALDFQKKLEEKGFKGIIIAINISVIQLLTPGFAEMLIEIIHKKKINPKNVVIEITESIFEYDFDFINSVLVELKKSGLALAIDDFGSGYSSLAREMNLNVNYIKIDKFFIDHILAADRPITGHIIEMAHKQGHYVVAEGVENIKQIQYLKEHGCDKVQGFLISKPLDENAAVKFINEYVNNY